MTKTIKIAACQTPDIRNDINSAIAYIKKCAEDVKGDDIDVLCFPEMFLQGYEKQNKKYVEESAIDLKSTIFREILSGFLQIKPTLIIGLAEKDRGRFYNTAIVIKDGMLIGKYRKNKLLESEKAIFTAGIDFPVFGHEGVKFGLNICYDMNFNENTSMLVDQGADIIIGLANNMLPYESVEKWKDRHNEIRAQRCAEHNIWLVSSDVTGERDGLISYGPTAFIDPKGRVVAQLPLGRTGIISHHIILG